jgi:hypothetical protein
MKKTEVNKYLNNGFKQSLGNQFKKNNYSLIKIINDFYFMFGWGIVDLGNFFPCTFSYGIGNLKYNNLYNYLINELNINQQSNKYLYAKSTGQLKLFDEGKYPILEYAIRTETDAQKMVDDVSDYILNKVLPEWEANPTIEYLEKKVNEKLRNVLNFSGLILAKMVENPDYDKIKQHFLCVSTDWAEWDKEDLKKVIEFLDNHTKEELNTIAEGK